MPVSNAHLRNAVQVWDGLSYRIMGEKDAKKAEKDGLVQITTNLQAKDLKTAAEFDKAREAKAKAKVKPKTKTRQVKADVDAPLPGVGKQTYKTREMKAE
jgi:hypothetical protein